ncbi:hypothetical protein B0H17DRAFT_1185903 [Mycena rosella]|uniref:Uncharacterized protein n=1 Tax=Mycena rosella TaxID=1033263 RepID=A0AAD7CPI9_MYCRO|nr:hypothetical protein B0H17DRAFT_1185903 [Mycena rosella]
MPPVQLEEKAGMGNYERSWELLPRRDMISRGSGSIIRKRIITHRATELEQHAGGDAAHELGEVKRWGQIVAIPAVSTRVSNEAQNRESAEIRQCRNSFQLPRLGWFCPQCRNSTDQIAEFECESVAVNTCPLRGGWRTRQYSSVGHVGVNNCIQYLLGNIARSFKVIQARKLARPQDVSMPRPVGSKDQRRASADAHRESCSAWAESPQELGKSPNSVSKRRFHVVLWLSSSAASKTGGRRQDVAQDHVGGRENPIVWSYFASPLSTVPQLDTSE